jgi:hypothetical protein
MPQLLHCRRLRCRLIGFRCSQRRKRITASGADQFARNRVARRIPPAKTNTRRTPQTHRKPGLSPYFTDDDLRSRCSTGLAQRFHILGTVNDIFRFKKHLGEAAKSQRRNRELDQRLTRNHHRAGSIVHGNPGSNLGGNLQLRRLSENHREMESRKAVSDLRTGPKEPNQPS